MTLDRLRVVLALAGLVFLLAGIARDSRAIVWAAIGLLGGAFAIRLWQRRGGRR